MGQQDNILILAENLWKIYSLGKQEVKALCGVSFTISLNEFMAIMGPSGSGKSTLMNLIGCLDTPTKGKYFLKGQAVGDLSENELARIRNQEIGFVFQVFNLLPRATAFHNVELPLIYKGASKRVREKKVRQALKMVEMEDRMNHRPSELSGGESQRVAIARALVNEPSLLLADEPTGNLDSENTTTIYKMFRDINERYGTTFIIVTHDRRIAEETDRIVEIRDGRIVVDIKK